MVRVSCVTGLWWMALLAGCSAAGGDFSSSESAQGTGREMGATVHTGGVAFRVWAPNATKVFVRGDFDSSEPGSALASEGNGVWAADVKGAHAGQQYEFVIDSSEGRVHRADPRSRQVIDDNGTFKNSVVVDPNAYAWKTTGFKTPSFDDQVLYELHIGTFADTNGPGTGTWKSAITKLDKIAALGVNMLEVLPPNEFQGSYSWGYNPSFPFAAESSYGSPDDVKRFVDAAHSRGMGVIVDIVHNHYGPELGRSLWCFDGPCNGFGGIFFYSDWRRDTGFGARVDFGRPEVRDFVADNSQMWLKEYRVDGLRWDSTINIRRACDKNSCGDIPEGWQLLQRVNDEVNKDQPWKIMIAEDLQQNEWVTKDTASGGAGFDAQWETEFFYPMKDALLAGQDSQRDMGRVSHAITHGYNGRSTSRIIFTENHDQVAPQNGGERLAQSICPGMSDGCKYWAEKRTTLGLAVMLTSPGIPMLFQGQEFVDNTPFPFGRDMGIDWSKATKFPGISKMVTDLIHLRRNWGNQSRGLRTNNVNVFHRNDADKIIAYHRWDQGGAGDDIVVVANFGNKAFTSYDVGLPRGGQWKVRFNGDWKGYSPDFDGTPSNDTFASSQPKDGLGYSATIGIGPYSVVILSQ